MSENLVKWLTYLFRVADLHKSFKQFFIETMICYLSIPGRINFSRMARYGSSCESRFRQNFKRKFDWVAFNTGLASRTEGHLRAIAIDPCYIPTSGKKTPGLGYFWSGTANDTKRGLEILGMALVDATDRLTLFLTAVQTFMGKRKGRTPDYLVHMDDPDSLIGLYLRAFASVADRLRGLTDLVVADAYFAKRTFVTGLECLAFNLVSRFRDDVRLRYLYNGPRVKRRGQPKKFDGDVDIKNPREDVIKKTQVRKVYFSTDLTLSGEDIYWIYRLRFAIEFLYRDGKQFTGLTNCQARSSNSLDFAFNASLSAINIAKALSVESGLNLSVEDVKLLIHNTVMVQRILSTFGKTPNLNLNQKNIKELLFYGLKTAA